MDLQQQIDQQRAQIRTDAYQMEAATMAYFVHATMSDGVGAELNIEHISSIERTPASGFVTVRMQNGKFYTIEGAQVDLLDHAISRINGEVERRLEKSETGEE